MDGTLSALCGVASTACWLFAQIPQLVHNYRTHSVDGLALPFLLSWLLGDATNLLGCILTDQLAFQRNLAAYFCVVDLALTGQYFWYTRKDHDEKAERLGYERLAASGELPPPVGREDSMALAREAAADGGMTIEERWRRHNRMISSGILRPVGSVPREYARSLSRATGARARSVGYVGSTSADRIHADDPRADDRLADSQESLTSQDSEASSSTAEALMTSSTASLPRGRALARSTPILEPLTTVHATIHGAAQERPPRRAMSQAVVGRGPRRATTLSPTVGRPTLRTGRQQTTMIFLSAFALFSFRNSPGLSKQADLVGKTGVESRAWEIAVPTLDGYARFPLDTSSIPPSLPPAHPPILSFPHLATNSRMSRTAEPPHRDYQRIIGRLFAWLCTILYLTSRLPQIWKNYRRRSVEGLSITLFVMAALGNAFYVFSLLSSPAMRAGKGYLMESIPYLLGSGGTLSFDVTIFVQSCIYDPKRRARSASFGASRRASHAGPAADRLDAAEEEAQLYTTEPEEADPHSPAQQVAPSTKARSRTRSGGRRQLRGTSLSLERAKRRSVEVMKRPASRETERAEATRRQAG